MSALRRLVDLLDVDRCSDPRLDDRGWYDAGTAPTTSTRGQSLMRSRVRCTNDLMPGDSSTGD